MEKKRYLNQLIDLIKVLRKSEVELAKKHLIAYGTNHTINNRKMFQLYKCIKINEIHDFTKLKHKISPEISDESFNKLIRRTTERLQESLIIDINIKRKGAYSEIPRMKLFLRKTLMQGHILMTRGLKEKPLNMFNKVIRYGKIYELYDEIIEALTYSQVLIYNSKGLNDYLKVGQEMDFYEICRNSLYQAQRVQRQYEALVLSTSNKIVITEEHLSSIEQLLSFYKETNSSNILSYYLLIKIEIAKSERDFDKASDFIDRLLEVLKGSRAVYSSNRISYLYGESSNILIGRFSFLMALENLEKGIEFRNKEDLFAYSLKIKIINLRCFLIEFDKSLEAIEEIENKRIVSQFSIVLSKITYQKAISFFGLKEFKKSYQILSQKNEIEKDKEGWNVWIRIMRMLCSIEMLKLNLMDYDVENFRKYLQRINKQYEVRDRDKLVLKVLLELDKQEYDFNKVAITRKKDLDLLASTDKKYAWNPDSPELILFHEWFKAKLNKTEYKPDFEVYRVVIE